MTGSPTKPTQRARLLVYLRERGARGVTPLDALDHIQSFRLAALVHTLRSEGHDIETCWYTTSSGARVARYVLHEGPAQLGLAL